MLHIHANWYYAAEIDFIKPALSTYAEADA